MKKFLTGLAAVGMLFGTLSASHALTQFAVMNPVPTPPGPVTPYQFDNATQTFKIVPVTLDVTFAFLQPVPVIGTNTIPAKLTISASASSPMVGTSQPLENLTFKVVPANVGDVFGAGVLLETTVPDINLFPAGTLADLFSVGNLGFLGSEFGIGLVMSSSYLNIDPTQNQTATWSYSLVIPPGGFAPDVNGFLRDTQMNGNANFAATFTPVVPEPGSIALLVGFGVGGSLALIRRRRSR